VTSAIDAGDVSLFQWRTIRLHHGRHFDSSGDVSIHGGHFMTTYPMTSNLMTSQMINI